MACYEQCKSVLFRKIRVIRISDYILTKVNNDLFTVREVCAG